MAVRAWLARRPHWHVHFTPTSSWINQVERWFAELTRKQLQGGVRTSTFPKKHRTELHSTNPIQHLKGEIKRRTDVVSIFPVPASTATEKPNTISWPCHAGPAR